MQTRSRSFFLVAVLVGAAVVGLTGWAFRMAPAGGETGGANAPEMIGGPGVALGCFYRPRGLTCDANGRIFNVDQLGRLQVFEPNGQPVREWTMPEVAVGKPEGLAIDLDGNVLVADTHYSRVLRFNARGEKLGVWGTYGVSPGQFTYPLAVAVDRSSGRIYISEYGQNNDRVQIFSRDGVLLGGWGTFGIEPGQFRRPSGLAIGPDGSIYVADAVNHRIQVFSPDGQFLRLFGQFGKAPGDLAFPYDVAAAPDGTVVVCEFGNNRVQAFDSVGHSLGMVGESGSGPGQLATPWCLALEPVPGGGAGGGTAWRVIVADTLNHRLCRWRLEQIKNGGKMDGAVAVEPVPGTHG